MTLSIDPIDLAILEARRPVHTRPGIPTERNCRRLGCELDCTKAIMEQH